MKAKKVNEVQNFKRGQDPYDKLNIGEYDENYDWENPKNGDQIKLFTDIYDMRYVDDLWPLEGENYVTKESVLEQLTEIEYEEGLIFKFIGDDFEWYNETAFPLNHWWIIKSNSARYFKKLR